MSGGTFATVLSGEATHSEHAKQSLQTGGWQRAKSILSILLARAERPYWPALPRAAQAFLPRR